MRERILNVLIILATMYLVLAGVIYIAAHTKDVQHGIIKTVQGR